MKENIHMREGGQTLVIVALAMAVLMLMAGLAVDVGMAYNERRDMQNAADAAALAGAQRLCDGSTQSVALNAAVSAGQLNGATTV
ncbi:MAG: pilus assembly protein TadG, partial [Chloroflexi bacterium]|nr:pilus assembly protein TadG [Chloroflexota bacterium]